MEQVQTKQAKLVQTEKIVRKTNFSITAHMRIEEAREGLRLVTQEEIDELESRAKARFEARYEARKALGIDWFAQWDTANAAKIDAYLEKHPKAPRVKGGAR